MTFSQMEARIAAQYAVDTETEPAEPRWLKFRHVLFDVDGLVHRVTSARELGAQVHDEVMLEIHPWTGCGIPLHALAEEAKDDPTHVGFRDESTALTCMACASGLPGMGDVYRQVQKQLLFGAAYGASPATIMQSVGRMSGKSNFLRQLTKYQQFAKQLVAPYAKQDTKNALELGNAIHQALQRPLFPRKRRFSSRFMRQLARAVLP